MAHQHSYNLDERFDFTGKMKMLFLVMIGVGLVSLVATFFFGGEDSSIRFWTNYLHNTVFFTGIAFMSMFVLAAKTLAYSGWHTVWKRLFEASAQFLGIGLLLIGVVVAGIFLEWHNIYHWNFPGITDASNKACYDPLIDSKSGFLNPMFYTIATVLFGGIWFLLTAAFRKLSLSEDESGDKSFGQHGKMKIISAIFMPLGGFTSAALIWLWVMSIDAHWYSTMFAWYATASWLVSAISLLVLTIIYLKSRGYFSYISQEHMHDLGKYVFGFSIFWTYLWFSQFMLIWYANVGEETVYFQERMQNYTFLFWANLFLNFLLPLLILLRNDTKRKFGTLTLICVLVFIGHWLDFFQMIKPGALHTEHEYHHYECATHHGHDGHDTKHLDEHHGDHGHGDHGHGQGEAHGSVASKSHFKLGFTIPGFLEIGTFIGFLGLFLFVMFSSLAKARLVPINDPYMDESLHHHVGYGGGDMEKHGRH